MVSQGCITSVPSPYPSCSERAAVDQSAHSGTDDAGDKADDGGNTQ